VSGALGGLTRLRRFAQDDAHIFCTEAQIGSEVAGCLDFIAAVYRLFGFTFRAVLSTRPESGSVGDAATWATAERELGAALQAFLAQANGGASAAAAGGCSLEVDAGGGAFYGPKIDVFVKDALGREHQCATVQLDFNLPRRFGLKYRTAGGGSAEGTADAAAAAGEGGSTAVPVMIHRAVLGSLERFMGILIEHTAGKWPFWLSPRQVLLCTVSERHEAYAQRVSQALRFPPVPPQAQAPPQAEGAQAQAQAQQLVEDSTLWVDIDASPRTVNKKVREGQGEAYNLLILLGDEEERAGSASVRFRDAGSLQAFEACWEEVAGGVGEWKQRGVGSGTWGWGRGAGGAAAAPASAPRAGGAPAGAAAAAAPSAGAAFASPLVTLPVPVLVDVCRRMQRRRV
jgi:threonyl-tRNA synthetase